MPALLAGGLVLVAAFTLLVHWEEARQERQLQEVSAAQARLQSQLTELARRRELLREFERLTIARDFYLLADSTSRQLHLRLQDRTLRRIPWTTPGRTPSPGRYTLTEITPEVLRWEGLAIVAQPADAPPACPTDAASCLVVSADDLAALSRLTHGTVLLVLP